MKKSYRVGDVVRDRVTGEDFILTNIAATFGRGRAAERQGPTLHKMGQDRFRDPPVLRFQTLAQLLVRFEKPEYLRLEPEYFI